MKKLDNLIAFTTLALMYTSIAGYAMQNIYLFGFSTLMLIIILYVVIISNYFNKK